MGKQLSYGNPLQVLKFNESENSFDDASEKLEKLFRHERVKDREIVIFSIIGAFRRGKSFFLDYCLRFLYANYESLNNPSSTKNNSDWIGSEYEILNGFSWRSGVERDTTGIIFWSDVFLHTTDDDKKIAIFIVDTQGLFDNETTLMENSKVFAITSLISSIQVINVSGNIREDELQHFTFSMEFGKLAERHSVKPFQRVVFLVRDWQNEDEFELGAGGGYNYLNHVLEMKSQLKDELKSVRNFILNSCESVACILLPHPGKKVAARKNYQGQWAEMDDDFKVEFFKSIEKLLAPKHLIVKKVSQRAITAGEFYEHIKIYFKFFQSKNLPKVSSVYDAIVEKEMELLIEKCHQNYADKIVGCKVDEFNISSTHERISKETFKIFDNERKLGTENQAEKARDKLRGKITKSYEEWRKNVIAEIEKEKLRKKLEDERKSLEAGVQKFKIELSTIKNNNEHELEKVRNALQNERSEHRETKSMLQNEVTLLKEKVKEQQMRQSTSSSSSYESSSMFIPQISSFSYAPAYSSNYGACSPSPSSYSSSSSSSRGPSSWNQFQKDYSANVWSQMSASERRSAGNFNTCASRAYHGSKRK